MNTNNRYYLSETSSTNEQLKKLKQQQRLPNGYLVVTDYQTDGRGQQGNHWESQHSKNLLFSLLIYPDNIAIEESFRIIELVTLGIKNALDRYINDVSIKWPNDIYCQDKKLGGILIENGFVGKKIAYSIIGVGLNVNQDTFSDSIPNPVSMKQMTGRDYDRDSIEADMYEEIMSLFSVSDKQEIHSLYLKNLYRNVGYYDYLCVETNEVFAAKIKTVNRDGGLVLKLKNGNEQVFYFKEIVFL